MAPVSSLLVTLKWQGHLFMWHANSKAIPKKKKILSLLFSSSKIIKGVTKSLFHKLRKEAHRTEQILQTFNTFHSFPGLGVIKQDK